MTTVHVTRISGPSVYGHTTDHCDEQGCNGNEQFFSQLDAGAMSVGDAVELVPYEMTPCLQAQMQTMTSTEVLNFFAALSSAIFADWSQRLISTEACNLMQEAVETGVASVAGFENRHVLDESSDEHEADDEYSGGHHWDREDFCRGT